MTRNERLTATLDGDFVVFMIGMRVNKPLLVHRWLPVVGAMVRMVRELESRPDGGLLGVEYWFGRTTIMVQYWRSLVQLQAYASDRDSAHLPAWRDFNRRIGTDGTVGIWHETYAVGPGQYESIYVNMPPFGLSAIGKVRPASGDSRSAAARMAVVKVKAEAEAGAGAGTEADRGR